ncbi:MAG: nuclear transport factor 2 family protein [Blastocatellia bacterium]|nr:nuclear transport factor 2 family protein [Blastocatellia bacterium]
MPDIKSSMEAAMSNFTELIDRYIATWNETDARRRRDLIARTWTEDSTYVDPLMRGEGRDGIDAMIQGVQAQFPGLLFRRTGDVDAHNDRVRFAWELGPEGAPALAGGVDFGMIAGDRLQAITGFLDFAPKQAA